MEYLHTDAAGKADMAAELVKQLFDEGTFSEIGTYVKGHSAANTEQTVESVVTGYGSVDGRPVFAFIQNADRTGGVMTSAHAAKIIRLYELAMRSYAPVVGIYTGYGAAIEDGTEVLDGYGRIMRCMKQASRKIPQIAYVLGSCVGASAILASMADLRILAANAVLGFSALSVQVAQKQGACTEERAFFEQIGAADITDADMGTVRRALSYLPSALNEGGVQNPPADDINQDRALSLQEPTEKVVAQLLDTDSFLPFASKSGSGMITGFGFLNGRAIGVIANDKRINDGKLTISGAKQAKRLLELADRMHLPVLTLTDCGGVSCTAEEEARGIPSAMADLANAYSGCTIPLVTAIIGKAYGSAYTLMGSSALGADVVYAVQDSEIGTMSPEAGVELTMRQKLQEGADREALIRAYRENVLSPMHAAQNGGIDMILSPNELRVRIAAALETLAVKDREALK